MKWFPTFLIPSAFLRRLQIPLVLLSTMTLASAAFADNEKKAAIDPCLSKAKTQLDLNDCASADAEKAEAELNRVYKQVIEAHKDDTAYVEKLKAAQQAWLAFREAELASVFALGPKENPREKFGSVYPMCFSIEKTTITKKRTDELRLRVLPKEGDVCP